ncbi:MAG: ATP-binding protein [Raineya sp.]|jgi:signal transduction histidine kinase/ligand-binding sensor domain-containing protein|nr:ATP-binding protein [Raineya sp.]
MQKLNRRYYTLIVCWLCFALSYAQEKTKQDVFLLSSPKVGLPFIQNFSPKNYHAGGQNFCVLQDNRGVMYFGNSEGVLEYDGTTWRVLPLPNRSEVHALEIDKNNVIYVGGQKEFGFLTTNEVGSLEYVSLLKYVDEKYRSFGDVWSITPTEKGVYFRTAKALYRWEKEKQKVKVWELEGGTNWGYWVNNRFFLYFENKGLFELQNEEIKLVNGGEKFKNEVIYGIVPSQTKGEMLVFTENIGMMSWDGVNEPKPIQNAPVNVHIKKQTLQIKVINQKLIAIGTRRNGLLLIDYQGNIQYTLNMEKGLQDNFIWALCLDNTGNLWVAFNNGISLVELNTHFTYYNENAGLYGHAYQVLVHKNYLYVATSIGTFYKPLFPKSVEENRFKPIININTQTWRFQTVEDGILVTANNGIFFLKDTTATLVPVTIKDEIPTPRSWFIMPIPNYPQKLFVNTALGLLLVEKEEGKWQIKKKIKGIARENLFYMIKDDKNNVWIDNYTKGVFSLYFHKPDSATLKLYGKKDGLPEDVKNRVFKNGETWFISSNKGIFTFNYNRKNFEYNPQLSQKYLFSGKNTEVALTRKNVAKNEEWIVTNEENKDFKKKIKVFSIVDGKPTAYHFFEKSDRITIRDIIGIDSITFFATSEGIYEHHHTLPKNNHANWRTYIRQVSWKDSLLYNGSGQPKNVILPYSNTNINFIWASTDYSNNASMLYQFILEGFDKEWSEWGSSNTKSYTNLPEGRYTFRVKARNVYGYTNNEATYTLEISPPWYRTIWAYLVYFLLLLILIFLVAQMYAYRLKSQNKKLEVLVQERSAEIRHQKEDIEAKNAIISKQNEELKNTNQLLENRVRERTTSLERAYEELLKINRELDNFTYRAAHDIRGPLSRLIGLCVVAEMDLKEDEKALNYVNLVKEEALNTQNVLVKLVRVYEVKAANVRIASFSLIELIQQAIQQVKSMYPAIHADIEVKVSPELNHIKTDQYLLLHCIVNIVENAMIYSREAGSKIVIEAEKLSEKKIKIKIIDQGLGIDSEIIPKIFDMFYRGTERSKGTGLGLYITQIAMNKLDGNIEVNSEGTNKGAMFVLNLPIR